METGKKLVPPHLNQKSMPTDNGSECGKCGYPIRNGSCGECDSRAQEKKKQADSMARVWGGFRALEQYTLENLKPSEFNADAIEAAKNYDPERENLFIFGPTGAGKSHMAVAAMRSKYPPLIGTQIVWKPSQISRAVRGCASADKEEELIRRLSTQKLLIIDDFGMEKPTEFLTGLIYEVIEGRDMNRPGGMIVTSNLGLNALAQHLGEDRITSRLSGMCKNVDLMKETTDWRQERTL